jgi:hypothetical protein
MPNHALIELSHGLVHFRPPGATRAVSSHRAGRNRARAATIENAAMAQLTAAALAEAFRHGDG